MRSSAWYGIMDTAVWPWRNIIRTKEKMASLATYGAARYLQKIADLQKKYSDVVIIPGVEAAPFYYWTGSPYAHNFKLRDWHKHVLVIGLNRPEDYEYLPSVANKKSLRKHFGTEDLLPLWPALIIILGVISYRKRKYSYTDAQGHALGPYSSFWHLSGLILIFFGILSLINNYPFTRVAYDQYHGEQGIKPYQCLIDYANNIGALTFWAHPEATNISKRGDISIETEYYAEDMLRARRYTGFAIFYDGFKKVGSPGGIWDKILTEYCNDARTAPIWAIASQEYDQGGSLASRLQGVETVVLVKELNQSSILKALGKGHAYVIAGDRALRLERFEITDTSTPATGLMGEKVNIKGFPTLNISGGNKAGDSLPVTVRIIRNGNIIETLNAGSLFSLRYTDKFHEPGKMVYYRLEIRNDKTVIVTNPIFVNFVE